MKYQCFLRRSKQERAATGYAIRKREERARIFTTAAVSRRRDIFVRGLVRINRPGFLTRNFIFIYYYFCDNCRHLTTSCRHIGKRRNRVRRENVPKTSTNIRNDISSDISASDVLMAASRRNPFRQNGPSRAAKTIIARRHENSRTEFEFLNTLEVIVIWFTPVRIFFVHFFFFLQADIVSTTGGPLFRVGQNDGKMHGGNYQATNKPLPTIVMVIHVIISSSRSF